MGGSGGSRIAEPVDLRKRVVPVPQNAVVPAPHPYGVERNPGTGWVAARRKGDAFERQCRKTLEAAGYLVVRAAGSHGTADLVAMKNGTALIVQCKTEDYLPRDEWNALRRSAETAGALPILVAAKNKGGPKYPAPLWWLLTADKDGTWDTAVRAREPFRLETP